jgi:hypothetical protein
MIEATGLCLRRDFKEFKQIKIVKYNDDSFYFYVNIENIYKYFIMYMSDV